MNARRSRPRRAIDPALDLEFGNPRKGDAGHTHADSSNANELLWYEPTTDIWEGVVQCSDRDRANQAWDDPLVRQS